MGNLWHPNPGYIRIVMPIGVDVRNIWNLQHIPTSCAKFYTWWMFWEYIREILGIQIPGCIKIVVPIGIDVPNVRNLQHIQVKAKLFQKSLSAETSLSKYVRYGNQLQQVTVGCILQCDFTSPTTLSCVTVTGLLICDMHMRRSTFQTNHVFRWYSNSERTSACSKRCILWCLCLSLMLCYSDRQVLVPKVYSSYVSFKRIIINCASSTFITFALYSGALKKQLTKIFPCWL